MFFRLKIKQNGNPTPYIGYARIKITGSIRMVRGTHVGKQRRAADLVTTESRPV
jgi:hypothetical protein